MDFVSNASFLLQKLHDEALSFEGRHKDVLVLSENVVKYLVGISSDVARGEVQETVANLTDKYNRSESGNCASGFGGDGRSHT